MASSSRPTVYFHIGAPKTGTTYLQRVLWRNRKALRGADVLYPGEAEPAHFWACLDLRGTSFHGYRAARVPGAWGRLVGQIRDWHGVSVIDHELFSPATKPQIARAMADLDFAEVHLVYTARDMARQLPAVWQEMVKNASTISFNEFLESVCRDAARDERATRFWALQDTPAILARWSRTLPPERVHVITVPPAGSPPSLLWERFARLLELEPHVYDGNIGPSNTSLGAAEAAVLRQLNAELGDLDLPWPVYARTVKGQLGKALAERRGPRIGLPAARYDWAYAWSKQTAEEIAQAGYHVVGDVEELVPGPAFQGQDPDTAPAELQVQAAVEAMAVLLGQAHASAKPAGARQLPALRRRSGLARDGSRQARFARLRTRVKAALLADSAPSALAARIGRRGPLYRVYRRLRHR